MAQDGYQDGYQEPCNPLSAARSLAFYMPFILPVPQFLHPENKNDTAEGTLRGLMR